MAWKRRSRPCLAEPPAESPSTMYSSLRAGSRSWQSASLPGSAMPSSAPLRMTRSRALRAASRARAAVTRFLDDPSPVGGVLLEVLDDALGDRLLDDALDVGVAQLGLGLALELRIGQLDADDRGEALAHVVAGEVRLLLREGARLARPVVEDAGQRGAEAGDVRAAVDGMDVVGEGQHVLGEAVVVLERDLDAGAVDDLLDVDGPRVEHVAPPVQVPHEQVTPPSKKKFFSRSMRSSTRRIQRPLLR